MTTRKDRRKRDQIRSDKKLIADIQKERGLSRRDLAKFLINQGEKKTVSGLAGELGKPSTKNGRPLSKNTRNSLIQAQKSIGKKESEIVDTLLNKSRLTPENRKFLKSKKITPLTWEQRKKKQEKATKKFGAKGGKTKRQRGGVYTAHFKCKTESKSERKHPVGFRFAGKKANAESRALQIHNKIFHAHIVSSVRVVGS